MRWFGLTVIAGLVAATPMQGQGGFKVYISVDMEGIAGVVTAEQLGPTGFEYQRFREFMTAEALAAVEAAKEAGATEIVISDSHGNGQNLLIERFPSDVTIIRAWPRPLGMMEGIDSSFAAAIFIGYHSGTSNPAGVRAHTFSSANYAGFKANGKELSEGGWNAMIAGQFGVPVVLISGDESALADLRAVVPDVEAAVVKHSISFHSAATATPQSAQALIRLKVKRALGRRQTIKPVPRAQPVTVDLTFKSYLPSVLLSYLPLFSRVGSHAIRFQAKDMVEASRIMQFVASYESGLTP
ncbi:MAG TPA: M55 family metallopeptidase [Gemmatimonadales bacterium]